MRCQRISVARPGVGVESVVLKIFIGGPVEGRRAGLGNDADLRAGCPAVLRGGIQTEYLDLLRGVHICCAQTSAVRSRTWSRRTGVGDQHLRGTRSVVIR